LYLIYAIQTVEKMKRKIVTLEDEVSRLNSSAGQMDKQVTTITEQMNKMSANIQHRIPEEEHKASVQKCEQ